MTIGKVSSAVRAEISDHATCKAVVLVCDNIGAVDRDISKGELACTLSILSSLVPAHDSRGTCAKGIYLAVCYSYIGKGALTRCVSSNAACVCIHTVRLKAVNSDIHNGSIVQMTEKAHSRIVGGCIVGSVHLFSALENARDCIAVSVKCT